MINANPLASKSSQIYEWQGRQSLALVDALLADGLPMTKVAKRFGTTRENIMATYQRAGRTWPGYRGQAHNRSKVCPSPNAPDTGGNGLVEATPSIPAAGREVARSDEAA